MKNGIILSAIVFTLSLTACSNYLEEFEDEYRDSAYAKTDIFSPTESSASIIDAGDSSGTSSKDASSSDARAEGQSSGKTDEEYDCYMNDSACISEIANEFGKTVRLLDSRNNNVYTAIYVGGLYFETAFGESVFDDFVSFLLMTENLEYEGDSVTALDTNGVFFYTYENAEKACPTGWRLPKITPEWSFLLKGDGSQFYIELPDDEKGCYTDGKFDSGKSIFYWAQKEGETSWFVQKNYLANDNSELPKKCNAFPVRCAKEFGRYADYAGSSSSSGETKSSFGGGNTSLSVLNCDDFGGDTLYDSDNVGGHVLWNSDLYNYGYNDNFVSNIVFDDKVEFCVEYKDVKKDSIPMAYLGNANYGYFYKYLSKDASAATFTINSNSDSCTTAISSTSKACESSNRQNVMENFKNFVIQNATATKIMVKGEYTIEYLSSSSSSVKSQSSSSSNISSSSGLQNCDAFKKDEDAYDLYGSEESLFGATSFNSSYEANKGSHLELNENSKFCIEYKKVTNDYDCSFGFKKSYAGDSSTFFLCTIKAGSVTELTMDDMKCEKKTKSKGGYESCVDDDSTVALRNINYFYVHSNVTVKNVYVKNAEIKANSSSSSVKSSSSSAKSSSSCEDIFNSSCLMSDAAKILNKNSSSSISGTLLFEAKDSGKMKNGEEISTRSSTGDLNSSFADGWMKVSGYSQPNAPQVAFFANPGLETEAPNLPVDIGSWGGVCVTYSSNVDFMLVAHYNWNDKIENVEIGKIERTTSAYPVTQKCLEWGEKKNSLTAIDQISLIHIQEGDDPEIATIYIKNISTVKKNEVVINVEGTAGEHGDLFYKLEDETIDLTLFGSFTVPKDVRDNNIYLMVTADGKDYYSKTAYLSGVAQLDKVCGPVEDTSSCPAYDQDFSTLQNPVLNLIGLQNLGQFNKGDEIKYTVTFHPKSWYAAPASTSTSN